MEKLVEKKISAMVRSLVSWKKKWKKNVGILFFKQLLNPISCVTSSLDVTFTPWHLEQS